MTRRFKTSLAAGLAVVLLAGAATMLAQDGPQRRGPGPRMGGPGGPMGGGPMRGGFGPGFGALDLTDDQKAQLKSIADSHQDEFRQAGQKVGAAREAMRTLIEGDTLDESAIRAKSAEVAAAEAEMAILNAKVRQQSLQVLTSEQQAKLKELRASRPGPRQRRPPQ